MDPGGKQLLGLMVVLRVASEGWRRLWVTAVVRRILLGGGALKRVGQQDGPPGRRRGAVRRGIAAPGEAERLRVRRVEGLELVLP